MQKLKCCQYLTKVYFEIFLLQFLPAQVNEQLSSRVEIQNKIEVIYRFERPMKFNSMVIIGQTSQYLLLSKHTFKILIAPYRLLLYSFQREQIPSDPTPHQEYRPAQALSKALEELELVGRQNIDLFLNCIDGLECNSALKLDKIELRLRHPVINDLVAVLGSQPHKM